MIELITGIGLGAFALLLMITLINFGARIEQLEAELSALKPSVRQHAELLGQPPPAEPGIEPDPEALEWANQWRPPSSVEPWK